MAEWQDVCGIADLQTNSGVCALVDGQQVAIFFLLPAQTCYAISNFDPFGNANVLSRGLIGDINGQPVVVSPLYKHHFNLQTGVCLEDDSIKIPVYPIRLNQTRVEVNVREAP